MKKWTSMILVFMLVMATLVGCSSEPTVNEDAETFLEEAQETVQTTQEGEQTPPNDVKPEGKPEDGPPEENVVIKVGVPAGVTAMSMVGAMDGLKGNERVNLEFEIIPTPDLIAAKLINNEVDAMVLPTNLAAILYNKGVEYKLAASTIWGTLYMVSTEEISDWSDLKGKEIYTIGRGLTPDVTLRYLLTENGLDPDTDVTITYVSGATELAPTFLSGRSTISVMPEPMLSAVLTKNKEAKIIFDFQKEWGDATGTGNSYPQASLVISSKTIEENPRAVGGFLRMVDRSANWINENPEMAGEAAEALDIGLKKAIVMKAIERSNIRFVPAPDAKSEIVTYFEILMESSEKLIGGKMPDEDFYYQR